MHRLRCEHYTVGGNSSGALVHDISLDHDNIPAQQPLIQ